MSSSVVPGVGPATRRTVAVLGVVAGFAAVEHGVGEIVQGPVAAGPVIESWPDVEAFEVLDGEPAMTLVGNMLLSGVLTIVVALVFSLWCARSVARPRDGAVIVALSVLLLLVGGGFGPPLVGLLLGVAVMSGDVTKGRARSLARPVGRLWRPALVVAVAAYLALFPGTVLVRWALGVGSPVTVAVLAVLAFAALTTALVAAVGRDRAGAGPDRAAAGPGRRSRAR
ncbi:hypothetical protein GCM10010492_53890 [Saccharothrix mutabilis subsp. mutabilis]|uniref:Uncharacterized protein n=1 Tax=Saccharothrix mutabilis subsp. mutabilis TaxID=66855 RepID=A0ABP3DYY9_9PSEU